MAVCFQYLPIYEDQNGVQYRIKPLEFIDSNASININRTQGATLSVDVNWLRDQINNISKVNNVNATINMVDSTLNVDFVHTGTANTYEVEYTIPLGNISQYPKLFLEETDGKNILYKILEDIYVDLVYSNYNVLSFAAMVSLSEIPAGAVDCFSHRIIIPKGTWIVWYVEKEGTPVSSRKKTRSRSVYTVPGSDVFVNTVIDLSLTGPINKTSTERQLVFTLSAIKNSPTPSAIQPNCLKGIRVYTLNTAFK